MSNRFCDTEIWTKDWYLDLSTKQKLLVKFLFDNCDCAGFYKISWHLLRLYFNDCEITLDDFKKIKQVKFISDDLIFIEDFALFQCKVKSFNELNPKNNAHKGVLKLLEKYNIFISPFQAPNEGLASPLYGAQEKDKDKDKDKEKDKEKEKEERIYGEYQNVCLTKEQYNKLLGICASEKLLNELVNSFSVNIEVGKERPYKADLPNAHFERLKSYYSWRKKYPNKFKDYAYEPQDRSHIFKELEEQARKEGKI